MKNLIPLFRVDLIRNWETSKEKIWRDAEDHYEQTLKKIKKDSHHLVYLCAPLKPTQKKLIQDHIAEAINAASQILGAEYSGKRIAVWIPHVHLFSIYNEIAYPQTREKAIKFNNHLLQAYFHTLVVVGDTVSSGMAAEIELAKSKRVGVVKIEDFKGRLKNLPDSEKAKASYKRIVKLHNKIHGKEFSIKQ